MSTSPRPEPVIPDHDVLRKIGGGAYGEVWMARGVTGALRAVKVVYREDFEDERGFEREFDGILKFEPISRDHPGFVNILHVGRSQGVPEFYYYVMELGDDIRKGQDINPVEYEARTLRSDIVSSEGKPLALEMAINAGIRVSEALSHLHANGLSHRDVKPANIIFVGGKAKLADIGLVASSGQRTFVGTEGFVPPEGPGSAPADVYSLGKVLYEISTGKDRLQFPELPDEHHKDTNIKQWVSLNQVICDVCEPKISQRNIQTSDALAQALIRVRDGKRVKKKFIKKRYIMTAISVIAGIWAIGEMNRNQPQDPPVTNNPPVVIDEPTVDDVPPPPPEKQYCLVKIDSEPSSAEVFDESGKSLGFTSLSVMQLEYGETHTFKFVLDGYRETTVQYVVPEQEVDTPVEILELYQPPVVGEVWLDPNGQQYTPEGDSHVSGLIQQKFWQVFVNASEKKPATLKYVDTSELGEDIKVVLLTSSAADLYVQWLSKEARQKGLLDDDQQIIAIQEANFKATNYTKVDQNKGLYVYRLKSQKIQYASLTVETEPKGALVFINGAIPDSSNQKLSPGPVEIEVIAEGYKRYKTKIELKANESKIHRAILERNKSAIFGKIWKNKLGMEFVPVGDTFLVSKWETRIKDYNEFLENTKKTHRKPPYKQQEDHPVVNVSREDAEEFCEWLTQRDRELELLGLQQEYRLPSDWEWSLFCDLKEKKDSSPAVREANKKDHYPWGGEWPIASGEVVGNFSDQAAGRLKNVKSTHVIKAYNDGYPYTSPVGSFPPNRFGICDLAGNVSEWVSNSYAKGSRFGVYRGSNIIMFEQNKLRSSARSPLNPKKHLTTVGFRIIVAKINTTDEE